MKSNSSPDSTGKKVAEYRDRIDEIDKDIVRLLKKRLRLSIRIISLKRGLGRPHRDLKRENSILQSLGKNLSSRESSLVNGVYREIFRRSIEAAKKQKPKA
jgi:chorismate mutase